MPCIDCLFERASALTAFLVASLHEDQYGVAQGDIPKVLEAFIQYLSTLESYAAELNRAADDGLYPTHVVRAQVSDSVQPTIDGKSMLHSTLCQGCHIAESV